MLDSTVHSYQYQTGSCIGRENGQTDRSQYNSLTELLSCCFACALVKRSVFEHIGLLDENMFLYFEDVDFGLRARIAGFRVVYCPNCIVYHARGGSTPARLKKSLEDQSRRYRLRIILKNYQTRNMFRYGGRWLFTDLIRVVAGLKNRDWKYANWYTQAILWNLAHFPIRERILTQCLRKVSDESLFGLLLPRSKDVGIEPSPSLIT